MTLEEAIKDINENILPIVGGKSLRMAVESLEKQIPKKPIWLSSGFVNIGDLQCCPVCNAVLGYGNYCDNCGQALDWSENNDT